MTDERPSERAIREAERLLRDWGIDPDQVKREAAEKEAQREAEREAARLELNNRPPEPSPQNQPTLGPGNFKNPRVETPEQRKARMDREQHSRTPETEKQPEPPTLDKAAERVRQIDEERPGRRMLAPWERDPRWGV